MTIQHLIAYLNEYQAVEFPLSVFPHQNAEALANNFVKVFQPYDEATSTGSFRSSAVGKHPFILAWEYFHGKSESGISWGNRFKFLTGFAFEATFNMLLDLLEIKYDAQTDIMFDLPGFTISGHPDYAIEDVTGKWILETKCVNETTFNQWQKKGYVDRPEYEMQLALYCLNQKAHGMFVVCNLTNGQLAHYVIPYEQIVEKYKTKVVLALSTMNFIVGCSDWWYTLERIAPPSCPSRKDGTYYFPMCFYKGQGKLHPAAEIFTYETNETGGYNVTGFNYPVAAQQWQPEVL